MAVISRGEAWPAAWHVEYSQVPSPWRALALRHATPRWADELAHRVHASARPGPDLRVWWPRTSLSLSPPGPGAQPPPGRRRGRRQETEAVSSAARDDASRINAPTRARARPPVTATRWHPEGIAIAMRAHRILLRARAGVTTTRWHARPAVGDTVVVSAQAGRQAGDLALPSPLQRPSAAQQWWWTGGGGGGRPPAPDHSLSLKRSDLPPPSLSAFLRRNPGARV
jgi:hypothetical protein